MWYRDNFSIKAEQDIETYCVFFFGEEDVPVIIIYKDYEEPEFFKFMVKDPESKMFYINDEKSKCPIEIKIISIASAMAVGWNIDILG